MLEEEAAIKKPETGESPGAQKPAAGRGKKKRGGCLKGCLVVLLILFLISGGAAFALWRALNPGQGRIAKAMINTQPDQAATAAVKEAFQGEGIGRGVDVVVIPFPDEKGKPAADKGSAMLVGIDLTDGFSPAETNEEMRRQAMQIVRAAVQANRQDGLDIKYSGCGFYNEGKPVAAMSTSMAAMEAWVDGRISDEVFLGAITIKVHDAGYYMNLAQEYLNASMQGIIRDIIFGPIKPFMKLSGGSSN
jgi:hypothetical protein